MGFGRRISANRDMSCMRNKINPNPRDGTFSVIKGVSKVFRKNSNDYAPH